MEGDQDQITMKAMSDRLDALQQMVKDLASKKKSRHRSRSTSSSSASPSGNSPSRSRSRHGNHRHRRERRPSRRQLRRCENSKSRSRSPRRKSPPQHRSWADRDTDETIDYSERIRWDDDDDNDVGVGDQTNLRDVSEETRALLEEKCTRCVSNEDRLKVRNRFPVPATRTPQLDTYLKSEVTTSVKSTDKGWQNYKHLC